MKLNFSWEDERVGCAGKKLNALRKLSDLLMRCLSSEAPFSMCLVYICVSNREGVELKLIICGC
jgi:hypothetical protein